MEPAPSQTWLHLSLQRNAEEVFEPDAVAEAPLVRFVAYVRHQRLLGWVRMRADRLTDLLNGTDALLLTDVELEGLDDGQSHSVDRVLVGADDLVAVHASGPRGDAALRHRTRAHAVAIQAGNYLIGGHLHAAPGSDPVASFGARPAMVPLTDAWIEYWSGGERRKHAIGTIIVNRAQVDWVRVVTDDELVEDTIRPSSVPAAAAP